ncbi:MAG: class IV adenylate cyclase [Spirochaetales bacterium]|nr:class IV adenylate cyclase [Spirochaetales bacterium]
MSIEVEIKAWVDDFNKVYQLLHDNFEFKCEYLKEDTYYRGINSITNEIKEIRVRKDNLNSIITYKERSLHENIEVNTEKEFHVDNVDDFIYVLQSIGFKPFISKIKKGFKFVYNNINLELSHVDKLGDFIEIESIEKSKENIAKAKKEIFRLLDILKVDRNRVEKRYYIEMLRNK